MSVKKVFAILKMTILILSILRAGQVFAESEGGNDSDAAPQVGSITEAQATQISRRINPTRQWKIGLGPSWASDVGSSKGGTLYLLGFVWGVDPNFDLDLTLRGASFERKDGPSSYTSDAFIGINYYFTRSLNAPFLTAGLGGASALVSNPNAESGSTTVSGWATRVGLGYKFFRTSTVNAAVEVNYAVILADSRGSDRNPGVASATLALYY